MIAIFEKSGKTLRVFDFIAIKEALHVFVMDYQRGRIYPTLKRIILKEYPMEVRGYLEQEGFIREMKDYSLYRDSSKEW